MQRIIETTMKRSILVIVSIFLILAWGIISIYDMQRDYLPPINNSTLMITVKANNYEAQQVKEKLSGEIEDAVKSVNGLQYLETNSFNGGLLTSLSFPLDFDMEKATTEVKQAVSNLKYPAGIDSPLVTMVTTNSFPVMRIQLTSNTHPGDENGLRTNLQNQVFEQFKSVPGVGAVQVTGAGTDGYVVTLHMKDLERKGITVDHVRQALESSSTAWPQASVTNEQVSIPIRVTNGTNESKQLNDIIIQNKEGKMIPLSDVADISPTIVNLQTISRVDGKPSVVFDVLKTQSSNITDVSDRVRERMEELRGTLPPDTDLSVIFDRGQNVKESLNSLVKEGLLGCVFSMLSILFFLRNVRATFLISLSLPISVLTTIGVLRVMGISLNILTVSGLIVAMGRVVDDSIVILDNMYRRVSEAPNNYNEKLLIRAVSEMVPAILSSTATTIAVFIPIVFVGGLIRSTFSAFAWTVVIALLVSLVVSLLVIPVLFFLTRRGSSSGTPLSVEPVVNRILRWSLYRKKLLISVVISLFLISVISSMYLPVNLLPTNGPREVAIRVELPEGNSLPAMDSEIKRIEGLLRTDPSIQTFSSMLGSSMNPQFDDVFDEGGGWIQEQNVANMIVTLKSNVEVEGYIAGLRSKLDTLPGEAIFTVTNRSIAGDDSKLKIVLTGADVPSLENAARIVRSKLQLVSGLSVEGANEGEPKYVISLDQGQMDRLGLNPQEVLQVMEQYQKKGQPISVKLNDVSTPVLINTDKINTALNSPNLEFLKTLGEEKFKAKDGTTIHLEQFASLVQKKGPSVIRERDGRPFVLVSADIISKDVGKVTNQAEEVLRSLSLPVGVKYSFGGISEQVKQMIMEVSIALAVSTLLVLLVISTMFKGWKAPFSVLLCIPFSIIGSMGGIILGGKEVNLAALIGILMLIGIVVTNGIVLVDKIERNRQEGMALQEAIISGTLLRARPILMTACTTILTLFPLVFSTRGDTVVSQTLGIVVIGGMTSSTLISLLVIPIIYGWLHEKRGNNGVTLKI